MSGTNTRCRPLSPTNSNAPPHCVLQRPGYAFKMGDRGLGYYKEAPATTPPPAEPAVMIAPEAAASALLLKERGNALLKSSELKEAEEAYSGAIALDHTQHTFFMNRSLCRLNQGNKEVGWISCV